MNFSLAACFLFKYSPFVNVYSQNLASPDGTNLAVFVVKSSIVQGIGSLNGVLSTVMHAGTSATVGKKENLRF